MEALIECCRVRNLNVVDVGNWRHPWRRWRLKIGFSTVLCTCYQPLSVCNSLLLKFSAFSLSELFSHIFVFRRFGAELGSWTWGAGLAAMVPRLKLPDNFRVKIFFSCRNNHGVGNLMAAMEVLDAELTHVSETRLSDSLSDPVRRESPFEPSVVSPPPKPNDGDGDEVSTRRGKKTVLLAMPLVLFPSVGK